MTIDWASYGLREPNGRGQWITTTYPCERVMAFTVFRYTRRPDGHAVGHGFVTSIHPTIESAAAHLVRLGCGLKA